MKADSERGTPGLWGPRVLGIAKEDAAMKALEVLTESWRRRPNNAGFTLMELLIVISIMLILMLIAIPNMLNLKATANETSAKQSLRAIQKAETQYATNYPANGLPARWRRWAERVVGTAEPPGVAAAAGRSGRRTEGRVHFSIVNCQKAPGSQQDNS